jgi:hypothetical protein
VRTQSGEPGDDLGVMPNRSATGAAQRSARQRHVARATASLAFGLPDHCWYSHPLGHVTSGYAPGTPPSTPSTRTTRPRPAERAHEASAPVAGPVDHAGWAIGRDEQGLDPPVPSRAAVPAPDRAASPLAGPAQSRGRGWVPPGNGTTTLSRPWPAGAARSSWFSAVSRLTARTRALTSARDRARSLRVSALFLRSSRIVARSRSPASLRRRVP